MAAVTDGGGMREGKRVFQLRGADSLPPLAWVSFNGMYRVGVPWRSLDRRIRCAGLAGYNGIETKNAGLPVHQLDFTL